MKQLITFSFFFLILFAIFPIYAATEQQLKTEINRQKQQLEAIEQKLAILQKQAETSLNVNANEVFNKNWQIKSYGSMSYKSSPVFRNTQDIDPQRRNSTDLERVVIEFNYELDKKWQAEIELEYEHGGTGAALEYDGFEEFGEFETEIEAGGEVLVEKLELQYQYTKELNVKLGHIFVPVGFGTELHKPNQYFTTERHWSESSMIPQVWHETGINVIGQWQKFSAQALLTTGLNSEYFRTHHWVATGHQKRFERVNADDLAITLRFDYGDMKNGSGIGLSYYTGDTSGNRNKTNKISENGNLSLFGLHGTWKTKSWQIRGQYLFGQLDDSQAITLANKTTPGLKPGNFSQLGSEAESAFIEVAFNSQDIFKLSNPLYLFANYEYANPIKKVEQGLATPRFDIQEIAFGVNYFPTKNLVFKMQIADRMFAQENIKNSKIFGMSLGYYFEI